VARNDASLQRLRAEPHHLLNQLNYIIIRDAVFIFDGRRHFVCATRARAQAQITVRSNNTIAAASGGVRQVSQLVYQGED
jgi:hypothetical protein